ncbi:hypothetical protein [Mycobacterium intracellulare]|uniref:hypothetical protein n=1 Tax=Mycobacterium intracellulare TaxID=1767 RepID=UPI001927BEA6|nr:hypothetical protein [Mycobacterium intracellulare]
MRDEPKCFECGTPLSYETGFTMTGTLADSSEDRLYCPEHAPDTGKGYTLSDLQRWREDNAVDRAKHEMAMMDLVGPDVYFAVKAGDGKHTPMKRLLDMNQRMYDKLREIGAIEPDDEQPT